MASNDIKTLTAVEHIMLRRQMYLGSSTLQEYEDWVIDNDKAVLKKLTYVEGIKKMLFEIIDNSLDEYYKTKGAYSTKVNITMTDTEFTCEDNGRGISVKKNENGEWMPYAALCIPFSGSNFEDDANRISVGSYGLGGKICSIFSDDFEATTCDGINKIKIHTTNNLKTVKVSEPKPCNKNGTKVKFTVSFKEFGVEKFSKDLFELVRSRLIFLSWSCPKATITFNGEKIKMKVKDLSSLFPQPTVSIANDNAFICIYPSEENATLSYINGNYLRRNGSHIDFILGKIVNDLRDKVSKKFKDVKPSDIRNRLGVVCFFNSFVNCTYDNQNKDILTNSATEISNYLIKNDIDIAKLSSKVLKCKEIVDNITDLCRIKEQLNDAKNSDKLLKEKPVSSEKYFPPIGDKKYLMITEGYSAFSGISPILGRRGIGYYTLMGKILNCYGLKSSQFLKNKEIQQLVNILGINLKSKDTDMLYDKVVVLSDADEDGTLIAGLVLLLFQTIAPKMIKDGRICRLETPLLFGVDKKGKLQQFFFKFPQESEMNPNLEWTYAKGLGSLTKELLDQVLEKVGGMDGLIHSYEYDDTFPEYLKKWFDKDSSPRKEEVRGKEFHIDEA